MSRFFPKKIQYLTVKEVLELTGSAIKDLHSEVLEMKITDIKPLSDAKDYDITFFANPKYSKFLASTKAGFCFIKQESLPLLNSNCIALISADPYYAFALLMNKFYGSSEIEQSITPDMGDFIATSANVSSSAVIGSNVKILDNVVISAGVEIGDNTAIMPNTFIGANVKIGKNVIIHDSVSIMFSEIGDNTIIRSGARIGASGFGFAPNLKTGKHLYIPQISSVIIGNSVDIGANTCIDRGCLENTIIEDNVKIDNLVQIAHGVHIKASCFISGGVGIAGSAEIGKFVFIGGQTAIAPHVKIADFVQIVGKAGVTQDFEKPGEIIAGFPAVPKMMWHKMHIKMQKLSSNRN